MIELSRPGRDAAEPRRGAIFRLILSTSVIGEVGTTARRDDSANAGGFGKNRFRRARRRSSAEAPNPRRLWEPISFVVRGTIHLGEFAGPTATVPFLRKSRP